MAPSEETKNYVTPYAFKVSDDLLGKRLASPSKRFSAITLDMIIVGLLATLPSLLLTGLIGVAALFGFNKLRRDPERKTPALVMLLISLFCLLILIIAFSIKNFQSSDEKDHASQDAIEVSIDGDDAKEEIEKGDENKSPSVVQWLQGVVADLGLSFGWAALYFTVCIAWFHGQTLAKLAFGIRVIRIDGRSLSLWDSFGRYGGYGAGFATGLLGFMQIYWDANRQAIQDKISETIVIDLRKPSASVDQQ